LCYTENTIQVNEPVSSPNQQTSNPQTVNNPTTIETSQPTQPSAGSKSTNWSKIILAAVLGLGLLATSAYAGYWYGTQQVQTVEKPAAVSQPTPTSKPTPTPTLMPVVEDETANWKTYISQKSGYSIKYPSGWKATELDTGYEVSRVSFSKTGHMPFLNVIHGNDITIDKYREGRAGAGFNVEFAQIANRSGYKITEKREGDGEIVWLVNNKGGDLLELVGQYLGEDKVATVTIYEKMANSLKLR